MADWESMGRDYRLIRDHVAQIVPGFERYDERVREPAGFLLPIRP
ncbi:MAG: hypothetical protein R2705_09720 [Ilumatobacteraceae bacterium]